MKNCNKCKAFKDLQEFTADPTTKDGRSFYCGACKVAYSARWSKRNPERVKDYYLRRKFGMTLEQYNALLQKQKGVCAICLKPETVVRGGKVRRLAVDHCHCTGKVRALLCSGCNQSLGHIKDDFDTALRLAKYLQEHNCII
jgi:hypothetical protein